MIITETRCFLRGFEHRRTALLVGNGLLLISTGLITDTGVTEQRAAEKCRFLFSPDSLHTISGKFSLPFCLVFHS